ncbi:hypothetical protein HAV22_22235 [Massilia sp. TW-1]|uniref:Uncharacterized protein n=1 Tax=Telluria antibiotica TaxID=2717319 RepID=A0ABX0PIW7_9BURK|nr:hypothetical protein [Telluria antibiotica]NIA56353.1 hypothetical protein [Telluria antibiotica]
MKRESAPAAAIASLEQAPHHEAWLLGQAPMRKYLDFVGDVGVPGLNGARPDLVREWTAAELVYEELERSEAGSADHPACPPLDPALEPLVEQVLASPRYTRTFDSLPTSVRMVDLARLVVCQNHVTQTFVDGIRARLGPDPDPVTLFHCCLPLDAGTSPVEIRTMGSKRYQFRSPSTDFRFHESVMLREDQLSGHEAFGAIAGALGLVVGFSCNFMNAVCDADSGRLLLHNGYHRACALLALGVRYAPCVVQTVGSRDELDIVAKPVVANDPGYFFNAPRPPLLKDFLEPRVCKQVPIKRMVRVIELSYEVRDYFMEA